MEKVLLAQEDIQAKKIMLTGDPVHWKEELRHIIGIHGYKVLSASPPGTKSGVQEAFEPDVVIMNVKTPPPTLKEAIRFTRSIKSTGKGPMLVYSSDPPKTEIMKELMLSGIFIERYRSSDQVISAVKLLVSDQSKGKRFVNWFKLRNLKPVLSKRTDRSDSSKSDRTTKVSRKLSYTDQFRSHNESV